MKSIVTYININRSRCNSYKKEVERLMWKQFQCINSNSRRMPLPMSNYVYNLGHVTDIHWHYIQLLTPIEFSNFAQPIFFHHHLRKYTHRLQRMYVALMCDQATCCTPCGQECWPFLKLGYWCQLSRGQ